MQCCSQHCVCWWLSAIKCQDICRYSDDHICVLHTYRTTDIWRVYISEHWWYQYFTELLNTPKCDLQAFKYELQVLCGVCRWKGQSICGWCVFTGGCLYWWGYIEGVRISLGQKYGQSLMQFYMFHTYIWRCLRYWIINKIYHDSYHIFIYCDRYWAYSTW